MTFPDFFEKPSCSRGSEAKKLLAGLAVIIGLSVIAMFLINWAVYREDDTEAPPDADPPASRSYDDDVLELLAADYCKDFVKTALKSPTSADFSSVTASGEGDGPWTVRGSVDADNSFGAAIRSAFVCTTHREGEGDWVLDSLTGIR